MGLKDFFLEKILNFPKSEPALTPEHIEALPSPNDITFYRDSKRLLQRFDEYVTAAETEAETLAIELDSCIDQQTSLETQLRHLNKPNSWHERHLLLKLDRLRLHGDNLKQRIEIYSQNVNVYLNLISKIQDIKAMRMNGLDESKMEMIWLDFTETLEVYKNRLITQEAASDLEGVTTQELETRLTDLKKKFIQTTELNEQHVQKTEPVESQPIRPPLVNLPFAQPNSSIAPSSYEEEPERRKMIE